MSKLQHILDFNQRYKLWLDYSPGSQRLKIWFDDDQTVNPRFIRNIMRQLNVALPGDGAGPKPKRQQHSISFQPVSREFTLRLSEEPIANYQIATTGEMTANSQRRLTVDETRRIGSFYHCAPYPRQREGMTAQESEALATIAKSSIFTDIHTHSSGQISAAGLLDVAMHKRPYYYPVDLLSDAGINTSYHDIPKRNRKSIKRISFPPLEREGETYPSEVEAADLHALRREDLDKLIACMALPADRQSTFTHLEYLGNRFRYPFSKDPSLTAAIRKKEAEEYAAQGVTFALSSYVGLDKPDILKIIHETVEQLHDSKKTKDFSQRYMAGIPRGLPLPKIAESLEKTKILLDSPYVMGLDMLGYESNKTKEFIGLLDKYAQWANENKPGSYIRVHAGENDKNHDNVKDFLKLAVKYPNLHFLVGHGVYGMDQETLALLQKLGTRVTVELNPSSNIALNNIDDVKQLPFAMLLAQHIPFIVGSDCAGMYQTDSVQLGLAAYYAGLDAAGFDALRTNQQRVVQHMHAYSAQVAATIPQWDSPGGKAAWIESMGKRLSAIEPAYVPPIAKISQAAIEKKLKDDQVKMIEPFARVPEFEKKCPITIIGASGESWSRLSKGQQRENAIAVDMLIHALGDNCYVVQGRNKKVGLSKVINQSLSASNNGRKKMGRPELYSVGMLVDPSFDDSISHKHLSHMIHLPGQTLDLARSMVGHTFAHHGIMVAVAGAAYTRDTILEADQRGILDDHPDNKKMMLLLSNTEGASAEKAERLHPDYRATDGNQLISKLFKNRPELFPRGFSTKDLNRLHEESKARVASYGYNIADSSTIQGPIEKISRTPVIVKDGPVRHVENLTRSTKEGRTP